MTDETQTQDKQEATQDQSESSASAKDEGSKSQTTTTIEQANVAAERLERANKQQAELLKRQEELAAYNRLGGQSDGAAQETEKKELSPEEYRKQVEKDVAEGKPLEIQSEKEQ